MVAGLLAAFGTGSPTPVARAPMTSTPYPQSTPLVFPMLGVGPANSGITGDVEVVKGSDAFTLTSGQELPALQAIEHFIGQKIPRLKLENFPYLYTALFEPESGAGGKRGITGRRTHRGYSFGRRR